MKSSTMFSVFFVILFTSLVNTTKQLCPATCSECKHGVCVECYYNYWGTHCQKPCVDCWYGGCNKITGVCFQCKPGRYTEDCSVHCPHKCRKTADGKRYCDRETGECLEGCKKGFWGSQCQEKCSSGCSQDYCFQANGGCFKTCRSGWYGTRCDSHFCRRRGPVNGECTDGCRDGRTGVSCNTLCFDGCATCNQRDGACTSCSRGFYGLQCESLCSSGCMNNTCDMTGICNYGCRNGFFGKSCNETCPSNCLECEQETCRCRYGKECLADDFDREETTTVVKAMTPASYTSKATTPIKSTSVTIICVGIIIRSSIWLLK